jgi:protein-disulfide isomerase
MYAATRQRESNDELVSITGCSITPQSSSVTTDAQLLSDQTPNPRGIGDPNAPVKISEYTDYQ